MQELLEKIEKRRTFAIISHPDAGKTTESVPQSLYFLLRYLPACGMPAKWCQSSFSHQTDGSQRTCSHFHSCTELV